MLVHVAAQFDSPFFDYLTYLRDGEQQQLPEGEITRALQELNRDGAASPVASALRRPAVSAIAPQVPLAREEPR